MTGKFLVDIIRKAKPGTKAERVFPAVVKLLAGTGMELESHGYSTQPLQEAVLSGNVTLVQALLDAGANPDGYRQSKESNGVSYCAPPLISARNIEVVDVLLQRGASPGLSYPGQGLLMFGGVFALLYIWKERSGISYLWDVMVKNGVGPETQLEDLKKSNFNVSLATAVFEIPQDDSMVCRMKNSTLGRSFQESHDEKVARRYEIQEMLVSKGFDLNGLASDGLAWGEHVLKNGSKKLGRLFELDRQLPVANPRPRKLRF